jgi:hypothetical protein
MKVGIILRGMTTGKALNGPRNWTITKDNLKENLIDSFREKYDVNVYITTYENSPINDVVDFYKPKRVRLLPLQGSNQRLTIIQSCLDIVDEDIDFVIVTRFDIELFQKFGDLNFDYNKFNFVYKEIEPNWTNLRYVSDVLFGFPKKYLLDFIHAIEMEESNPSRQYNDLHNMYNLMCYLIDEENIHFLHDKPHPEKHTCTPEKPAGDNHFYRIIRQN